MKNVSLLAGALLVTAPFALLISGCGGGNDLINSIATPTPLPTATGSATPTPTGTQAPQQTANFTLGNGQKAVLRYSTSGTTINGTLQILATGAAAIKTRALTYRFAVGTYVITGTFTPPRGFNISGTLNGQPLFTMTGQLPTATQTGSYTLTVDGQTDSGTIPRLGSVTPTATPNPTATPTAPTGAVTSTLQFTKSSDSTFANVPIAPQLSLIGSQVGNRTLGIGGSGGNAAGSTLLSITIPNPATGQTSSFDIFKAGAQLINNSGGPINSYYSVQSGTVTVNSFTATTASVTFNNIVFVPNDTTGATKGTVTLTGTVSGPYKLN